MPRLLSKPIRKFKWLILPIWLVSGLPSASGDVNGDLPKSAVLMFVAAWCAPCLTELARFDALERSAYPRQLLIVSVDEGPRNAEMLRRFAPEQQLRISPRDASAMMQRVSRGTAVGLPYAIMTDKAGTPCATRSKGLDEAELHMMSNTCG